MSRSVLLFSAALLAATPTFAPAGEPVPRRPEAIGRPMWTAFTTRWRVRSNESGSRHRVLPLRRQLGKALPPTRGLGIAESIDSASQ